MCICTRLPAYTHATNGHQGLGAVTAPYDSSCEDAQARAAVVLQWLLVPPQEQLSPATSLLCWDFFGTQACHVWTMDQVWNIWTSDCRLGCMCSSGRNISASKSGGYSACSRLTVVTVTCLSGRREINSRNLPSEGHLPETRHPCIPIQWQSARTALLQSVVAAVCCQAR